MAADVELEVGGQLYAGWKGVTITRGIESIAGGFSLEINDRWAGTTTPWPIAEEDDCALSVYGKRVLFGWVDKRDLSIDGSTRSFRVSGRDKAGALVDCSAQVDKLIYRNVPLLDFVRKLCQPFGVAVSIQPGLAPRIPSWDKLAINPGDAAHTVLEKACRMTGVLAISDGNGGILITQAGTARCPTPLVLGQNILRASASYDASKVMYRYLCLGSHANKIPKKESKAAGKTIGKAAAAAAATRGEAFDEETRRSERVLIINPEDGATPKYAQQRANWEAIVRRARAQTVNITVRGWTQDGTPTGQLWPLNALVDVRCDPVGVNGTMLIVQTVIGIAESGGLTTQIKLMRPDAFTPEPRIRRGGVGGKWKELVRGA